MVKVVRALVLVFFVSGCNWFVPVDPLGPAVTTMELTNVRVNSVTATGVISDPNYKNDRQMKKSGFITEFGFVLSNDPEPTLERGETYSYEDSTGHVKEYHSVINGLKPGVVYYLRAFAKNQGGAVGYGNTIQFLTKEPEPYTNKSFIMYGVNLYDLDGGNLSASGNKAEDLAWRYPGIAIYPMNGARFSVLGSNLNFDTIKYSDLINYTYSNATIDAEPSRNKIPTGTIVAYITNEGRYGKMKIDSYQVDMRVTIVTYNKP